MHTLSFGGVVIKVDNENDNRVGFGERNLLTFKKRLLETGCSLKSVIWVTRRLVRKEELFKKNAQPSYKNNLSALEFVTKSLED